MLPTSPSYCLEQNIHFTRIFDAQKLKENTAGIVDCVFEI